LIKIFINAFKGFGGKIRETKMDFFIDSSAEPYASPVGFLVRSHKVSNKVSNVEIRVSFS